MSRVTQACSFANSKLSCYNQNMKHRIFIAINIPDEAKRQILEHRKRWPNLKVRWTKFENIHITLEFLGLIEYKKIKTVLGAVEKTTVQFQPFDIRLSKIVLGPNPVQAKMFWATVKIEKPLLKLKDALNQNLLSAGIELEEKNMDFNPHITLARARGNELKGKKTNIDLSRLSFKAKSVEVIESRLTPGGAKHKAIGNFKLKDDE